MGGRSIDKDIETLREFSNSTNELVKDSSEIVLGLIRNLKRKNDQGIKQNYYDLTTYDIQLGNQNTQLQLDQIQQLGAHYYKFYQNR